MSRKNPINKCIDDAINNIIVAVIGIVLFIFLGVLSIAFAPYAGNIGKYFIYALGILFFLIPPIFGIAKIISLFYKHEEL